MKTILLLALMIILSVSVTVSGQEIGNEESSLNIVPEKVMQEVVRRILVYKFKPATRKRIIYLALKDFNQSWLPEITNIEFYLLTNEQVEDREKGVYFFTKPELSNKTYEIGFAFGNPNCDYIGDGWRFRITNNKVRLWFVGGIGGGCGGGDSFGEFSEPGQLNTYPNELKGYKFFDRGKLQGLKLANSTRDDVKNILGDVCESACDYDENWEIYFSYFDNISFERTIGDKKTKYVPKAEYIGKLYSITLRPKSNVLFGKFIFPSKFRTGIGGFAAHDGEGGGTNGTYHTYKDRYGLVYTILDEITLTTVKDLKWKKGELTTIEYTIPDKLEEKMFVEQN